MPDWTLVLPNNTTLGLTESNDLAVVGITGAGMPPIKNVYTPYGLSDGALWQRASVQPRLVTVLIDAVGTSWVGLHNLRAKLVEAVNPHGATPITIQYSAGGSKPDLYLDCYYDSGLEGGITEGFAEKGLALRLLATDPYWKGAMGTAHTLGVTNTIENAYNLLRLDKATGEWSAVIDTTTGTAVYLDAAVRVVDAFPTTIRVGGEFTGAYGNYNYVTGAWTTYTGINGKVHAHAWGPAYNAIFVAGEFTEFLGAPMGYIYFANVIGQSSLGGGLSDVVYDVWTPDGVEVYAGGAFETAGDTAAAKLAHWDGSKWNAMGAGIVGTVYAVEGRSYPWDVPPDIYVGGAFTTAGGITANNVTMIIGNSTYGQLGSGMNGEVRALCRDAATGIVYAGGAFTTAGNVAANHVAAWNGTMWQALDQGLNNTVHTLWVDDDGVLYAGGAFTASGAGEPILSGAAKYDAGRWIDAGEGQLNTGTPTVYAISGNDDYLFIGGAIDGEWIAPQTTTITNSGTARAYPTIVITGPGQLHYVRNNTTGQELRFNLLLFADETLTIDFSPGVKTVTSNFRGNMLSAITSGNLIDWWLAPGANSVTCWVADSTATATYQFTARYWSSDGAST